VYLGVGAQALDLRDLYEIVDTLAVKFEVEARVLEGCREFDYGLADFVYLFLGRDLVGTSVSTGNVRRSQMVVTNHNLKLLRLVREDNRQGEDGICKLLSDLTYARLLSCPRDLPSEPSSAPSSVVTPFSGAFFGTSGVSAAWEEAACRSCQLPSSVVGHATGRARAVTTVPAGAFAASVLVSAIVQVWAGR